MENKELLVRYKNLIYEGKDYAYLKRELAKESLPREEFLSLLVSLDEHLAHYQKAQQERQKSVQQMMLGMGLLVLGLLLYSFSLTILRTKYLFAFGILFSGAWIFREGYRAYQVPLEEIAQRLHANARRIKRKL